MSSGLSIAADVVEPRPHALGCELQQTWNRCCQSFCRYFTVRTAGDDHVVDDLMQQLWLRAAVHSPQLRADPEPWLWRIAQNLLREHRRNHAARLERRAVADPSVAADLARRFDTEDLPPELLSRKEVRDQLLLAITSLAAEDQELIIDHYFDGRSHAELAASRGISPRAVEGRLYRARRSLKDRLAHLNDEEERSCRTTTSPPTASQIET